jgi:uncharacterized protein (DUF1778 family)
LPRVRGEAALIKKKTSNKKKRTGIFIYCGIDLRARLKRAARFSGRTLSGYVLHCVLPQIEGDEARMKKLASR